nr:methyltransferase [uncultured Pseudomonas sp.]
MSMPDTLSGPQLLARFEALDALLLEHQQLWRPRPFTQRQLPWEAEHPQLSTWLRGRSLAEAEAVHNQPELLQAPWPYSELAAQTAELSAVGELPQSALAKRPTRLNAGVPGRKWQQIEAFASCLQFARQPHHWLDWCAGKGHLGRLLAHDGGALTCLEHDGDLIEAGQRLSERTGLNAAHIQQDVMADSAAAQLLSEHTPIALHACGDLHVRLLQLASQRGCQQLAVAPCCYNRIGTPSYQALSETAKASTLQLSLDDLGLPLSETVTAGARVRRQRDQSMAWRLAFDLLQRQLRGIDDYLPTPSLAPTWLNANLADYCRHLAALKQLPAPGAQDWHALESQGWQRLAEVRNLELVRSLFRRPLELWLLLDRALYLQEQGYSVHLGLFCPSQLTPRNLLLLAERP